MSHRNFDALDYVILAIMLLISAGIGVFFRFSGGKQKTASEYLMADRQMHLAPVAMSLLATFMSAITLLGTPSEIYIFGTHYVILGFAYCLMMPAVIFIFHPVFYNLQVTSIFEYLELRYHKPMRTCGAVVYIIQMILYLSIVLYAPAMALNAVTGLNLWLSVCSVGIVCTFYTTMGGMKAVMWTDLFQCVMMFAGLVAAVVAGCMQTGGIAEVWRANEEGGRIDFLNFNPDPTVRHSWWSLVIGGTLTWIAIYCNQAQVQRTLTTRTLREARIALLINLPGLMLLMLMGSVAGLVVYAKYRHCDPMMNGDIFSPDQLFPLLVMDTMEHIPGLPGLFVSCIFSGALSTMSSGLNSLATIAVRDIVGAYCYPTLDEHKSAMVSKIMACSFGVLCLALTAVAAQLGDVLQASLGLFGVISGPLLGLFTLGMMFPRSNAKGAWAGVVSSLFLVIWIFVGAQINKPTHIKPPRSIEGCVRPNITLDIANVTSSVPTMTTDLFGGAVAAVMDVNGTIGGSVAPVVRSTDFYSISHLHYGTIAVLTVIVVGMVVSWATGFNDPETLDPRLLCPWYEACCCCLPKRWRRKLRGAKETGGVRRETDGENGVEQMDPVELKTSFKIDQVY